MSLKSFAKSHSRMKVSGVERNLAQESRRDNCDLSDKLQILLCYYTETSWDRLELRAIGRPIAAENYCWLVVRQLLKNSVVLDCCGVSGFRRNSLLARSSTHSLTHSVRCLSVFYTSLAERSLPRSIAQSVVVIEETNDDTIFPADRLAGAESTATADDSLLLTSHICGRCHIKMSPREKSARER